MPQANTANPSPSLGPFKSVPRLVPKAGRFPDRISNVLAVDIQSSILGTPVELKLLFLMVIDYAKLSIWQLSPLFLRTTDHR